MRKEFTPKILKLDVTQTKLTSAAGLGTLIEAFDVSPLSEEFKKALPDRSGNRSQGAYRLGLIQLASFVRGHDCLDDLIEFRHDETLFEIMQGETIVPKTMGDFLRDFESIHLSSLNQFLSLQAMSYRKNLEQHLKKPFKPSLAPHLSIDSTAHVQNGKKMEGLAYNYKNEWCLDSQVIFDELGFCWDIELRPGNTKSGVAASEQIKRAFKDFKFTDEKYLSGDSAYCYQDVIITCLSVGAKFTLTANQATTGWENHISEINNWQPWVYTEAQLEFAKDRDIILPEIEMGRFHWSPSWNPGLKFPVVVKRTAQVQTDLFSGPWKYYGVVTNLDLTTKTYQEAIEFHAKRGNAENFIREEKYGYDLKHFPCLKLKANHAYGQIAMCAHNLLRWSAIHDQPHRPKFAKKMRRQFINIPAKMVSHGRSLTLKMSAYYFKEVNRLRQALGLKLYVAKMKVMSSVLSNPPIPTG